MKKVLVRLLTVCLVIAMLLPVASAEGICLNQLEQNVFVSTSFIEKEAYPEVILSERPFIYDLSNLNYVRFPAPDGTPIHFSSLTASFFIEEETIQQSYQLVNSAFEIFLNNASGEDMILLNEPTAAAYMDLQYLANAYGMISLPEIGKNSKLLISMTFHDYDSNTLTDKKIEHVKNTILAEIERVRKNISFVYGGPYWSDDFYDSIRVRSLHAPLTVKVDFKELPFCIKDNPVEYAKPFLTDVDDTKFVMTAVTSINKPKVEFDLVTYSYVESKKSSVPDEVYSVVLADGYEYDVWEHVYDNAKTISLYASRLLTDKANGNQNLYLVWTVSNTEWYTKEEVLRLLNALSECTTVETELELLNYKGATAETEEPQEEPAKSVKGGWGFFNANTEANANAEANSDAWTCDCGSENTSKFCPECGSKKPDYKCPSCDYVFEKDSAFKFCPECGTKR